MTDINSDGSIWETAHTKKGEDIHVFKKTTVRVNKSGQIPTPTEVQEDINYNINKMKKYGATVNSVGTFLKLEDDNKDLMFIIVRCNYVYQNKQEIDEKTISPSSLTRITEDTKNEILDAAKYCQDNLR